MTKKTDKGNDKRTSRFSRNMLQILLAIVKGNNTVTTISKKAKKDLSNTHRTLWKLIKKNIVEYEKETRLYYLSPNGKNFLTKEVTKNSQCYASSDKNFEERSDDSRPEGAGDSLKNIRGHRVAVQIEIVQKPSNWDRARKKILTKNHIDFTSGLLNKEVVVGHDLEIETLEKISIKTLRDSVLVHLPPRNVFSPFEYWPAIFPVLDKICSAIEKLYKIKLGKEASIYSNEFADERGLIATATEKQGRYLVYHDKDDGVPRFQIDFSKGFKEWETLHPALADTDHHRINQVLYDYAEHRKTPLPSVIAVRQESHDYEIKDLRRNDGVTFKTFEEIYRGFSAIADTMNMIRAKTEDPLAELKKTIKKKEQIPVFAPVIDGLSDKDRASFDNWVIKKFGE